MSDATTDMIALSPADFNARFDALLGAIVKSAQVAMLPHDDARKEREMINATEAAVTFVGGQMFAVSEQLRANEAELVRLRALIPLELGETLRAERSATVEVTEEMYNAFEQAFRDAPYDPRGNSYPSAVMAGLTAAIQASGLPAIIKELEAENLKLTLLTVTLDREQMSANEERDDLIPLAKFGLWVRDVKIPEDERDIEQMLCCEVVVDDGDGGVTDAETTTRARAILGGGK